MDLIIDHRARSQATAAEAGYPLHSELAIAAGFSLFGACRLGYRLCYSLCSAQMACGPMTDLDQILTYRFQSKLRIESDYAVYLTRGNAYVFCYACGVRKPYYQVFYWDGVNERFLEARIEHFLMGQPQPMRELVNPAVDMANAGLWKDALVKITEARDLAPSYPECDMRTLNWDYAMIKLHADRMAGDAVDGIYPLLSRVFYGDYAAAVDLMRPHSPVDVFDPAGSLIAGTVAEGMEDVLSGHIIVSADEALGYDPDLAEAYLMRGWARYLADPSDPQVRADVNQAAALRPGDAYIADCAALFP